MKRIILAATCTGVVLIGAGAFTRHVAWLADCRNYNQNGGLVSSYFFLKSACPKFGPYGPKTSPVAFALLSPFVPSGDTKQQGGVIGTWRIKTPVAPFPLATSSKCNMA